MRNVRLNLSWTSGRSAVKKAVRMPFFLVAPSSAHRSPVCLAMSWHSGGAFFVRDRAKAVDANEMASSRAARRLARIAACVRDSRRGSIGWLLL